MYVPYPNTNFAWSAVRKETFVPSIFVYQLNTSHKLAIFADGNRQKLGRSISPAESTQPQHHSLLFVIFSLTSVHK